MTDMALLSANTYTDVQGLSSIRAKLKSDPNLAKKEVAKQFESLMVQMLMKSMRDSNRALAGDSASGQSMSIYEDLLDKQLSLSTADKGFGLAEVIEKSLNQVDVMARKDETEKSSQDIEELSRIKDVGALEKKKDVPGFESAGDFVNTLWSYAKDAAQLLGADPKFLLAQAALESNWGKSIVAHITGKSSNNLFNIKADSSWDKGSVAINATEEKDGIVKKEKSNFRDYNSFAESFKDYVKFLESNPRYQDAIKHASSPQKFAELLQKANYATDAHYAEKIMQIYTSKKLNDLIQKNI